MNSRRDTDCVRLREMRESKDEHLCDRNELGVRLILGLLRYMHVDRNPLSISSEPPESKPAEGVTRSLTRDMPQHSVALIWCPWHRLYSCLPFSKL